MATVYGPYVARVVNVHDGDTIRFDLDLGFAHMLVAYSWDGRVQMACRVWGINAPELSTAEGRAAAEFARTLLKSGDICRVLSHGWDKYGGRFDGTVTLPDGRDFAQTMIENGHAVTYKE